MPVTKVTANVLRSFGPLVSNPLAGRLGSYYTVEYVSIRLKIILVVVPLLIVAMALVAASSFFVASNAVSSVTEDFLRFKARQLELYAEGQWDILVENELDDRPDMRRAAERGIEAYSRSIRERESEAVFIFEADASLHSATISVELEGDEPDEIRALIAGRPGGLVDIRIGGEERVGAGFYFEPFDLYYLISEPRDVFFSDIEQIARQSIIILAFSVAIAIILLVFFAGYLTRPVGRLVKTMTSIISSGDLSERVPVEYRDEIGTLSHTFNVMIGELGRAYEQIKGYAFEAVLAQKKEARIRNIFQKYVPQQLIDQFFENPEKMLVGDNREIAILFSDIRGFTSISESMRPDRLVDALNRYFSVMVEIIMNRGGIVDKYIGDAIMAFFGAPVRGENDALDSVLSGIGMAEALEQFNESQHTAGLADFRIGIGIAYGEVTVGNIGTDQKMDYTVIGDTVNLASRLEGLTKYFQCPLLVSESVRDRAGDTLQWREIDRVAVKGRKQGVRIYSAARSLDGETDTAWKLHNEAMSLYYEREFDGAAERLRQVEAILSGDMPAKMLRERCEQYAQQPPPADWDGTEVMLQK